MTVYYASNGGALSEADVRMSVCAMLLDEKRRVLQLRLLQANSYLFITQHR